MLQLLASTGLAAVSGEAGLSLAACDSTAPPPLPQVPLSTDSRFRRIYGDPVLRAQFLAFLTNVFHLMPEQDLHRAIAEACHELSDDRAIYERLLQRVPKLAPALSSLRFALPALAKQKREMADETARLVGTRIAAQRYVEIGTPGRYVGALRERMRIGSEVYLVHQREPSLSAEDVVERGQLSKAGVYVPLDAYAPLTGGRIPEGKIDLITNFIGLHHAPRARLDGFVDSIHGLLRPGGLFVLRDHDVRDAGQDTLVALAHDVFNAGLGVPWSSNAAELRFFQSIPAIEDYLASHGFVRFGARLAQPGDPTQNLLLAFQRA
jgi:SAM-dependent methyltransferase